jgi:pimeloyl-ACP methyl ester carboxylesterase
VYDAAIDDPMSKPRKHADDLRAVAKLAVTATTGITDLVEEMHRTIASGPAVLGRPLAGPVGALLPLVYDRVREVTSLVGTGIDLVLSRFERLLGESLAGPAREAVVAALNGVLGDYLEQTGSPLAIAMDLRSEGVTLRLESSALLEQVPGATGKLLVLVHGSSMNDLQWNRAGHDHGAALARDLGYTPIHVRYNSGLHVSTNGRALAGLIEALVNAWPVPLTELALLGHSMGGLVARSACHAAALEGHGWPATLRRLVCLGTPHHGSRVERGGNMVDVLLAVSEYSAPLARLGRIRSAGVTDLRYGNVVDEDWDDCTRFAKSDDMRRGLPLPPAVDCFAIAGTLTNATAAKLLGDGLVPVDSALGRHARPELTLAFPEEHQWVALGTGHLELLSSVAVYEKLRAWLA